MDLSEIFDEPRGKAKRAEALRVLRSKARAAESQFEGIKRELGHEDAILYGGMLISEPARLDFNEARRDAVHLLFNGYAEIAFDVLDTAAFVDSLQTIADRVIADLGLVGAAQTHHEIELCRLDWERLAWERAKPGIFHRIRKWFRGERALERHFASSAEVIPIRPSPGTQSPPSTSTVELAARPEAVPSNRDRVEEYLKRATALAGVEVTRKMFYESRRYTDPTALQAFERNDPSPKKLTMQARAAFEGQLAESVEEFVEKLRKQKRIPTAPRVPPPLES